MANIEITQCDVGAIAIGEAIYRDETVTFAAADTFVAGTILARREVALAVVASAITGSGTGTVTAASVVAGTTVPKPGVYTLRNILVVADGGVWQLEDPNGAIIASGFRQTVGAGAATVFEVGGFLFTITDGGTNFALNDTATLTVTADGKLVPFNPSGAGGEQVPCAVLTYDLTKAASGDLAARVLVHGEVNSSRLVIDAGGSVTAAILDQLRARGITGTPVSQLDALDNA
jgi:hypothetical protein